MLNSNTSIMFGIRAVFLLSLVINVLVNANQEDRNLDGELEVLLKRLQERLEDEERDNELEDLFEKGSMSGIEVDPDISVIFNDMKLKSVYKWVTFKIKDKRMIVVDRTDAPRDKIYDKVQFTEMKDTLTTEPRYILFDFRFISRKDGRDIQKMAFIFWCDDKKSKIGDRMLYASTKDTIKREFPGLSLEFQANDMDDINYEGFRAEIERKA